MLRMRHLRSGCLYLWAQMLLNLEPGPATKAEDTAAPAQIDFSGRQAIDSNIALTPTPRLLASEGETAGVRKTLLGSGLSSSSRASAAAGAQRSLPVPQHFNHWTMPNAPAAPANANARMYAQRAGLPLQAPSQLYSSALARSVDAPMHRSSMLVEQGQAYQAGGAGSGLGMPRDAARGLKLQSQQMAGPIAEAAIGAPHEEMSRRSSEEDDPCVGWVWSRPTVPASASAPSSIGTASSSSGNSDLLAAVMQSASQPNPRMSFFEKTHAS